MTTTTTPSTRPSLTSRVMAAWPFWVGPLMLLVADALRFTYK